MVRTDSGKFPGIRPGSTVKPDSSPNAPRPSTGGTGPYPSKEGRDSSGGGKERKG